MSEQMQVKDQFIIQLKEIIPQGTTIVMNGNHIYLLQILNELMVLSTLYRAQKVFECCEILNEHLKQFKQSANADLVLQNYSNIEKNKTKQLYLELVIVARQIINEIQNNESAVFLQDITELNPPPPVEFFNCNISECNIY